MLKTIIIGTCKKQKQFLDTFTEPNMVSVGRIGFEQPNTNWVYN